MGRVVELLVLANASVALIGVGLRWLRNKRRASNLDEILRLEEENKKIDDLMERRLKRERRSLDASEGDR